MNGRLAIATLLLAGAALGQAPPTAQTTPIPTGPSSANDTAIWVHPTDVGRSLVFGTDTLGGGLYAYRLNGAQQQFLALGPTRAVDVRYRFPVGAAKLDVVLAANSAGQLLFFTPDSDAGMLVNVNAGSVQTGLAIDAAALYFNHRTGELSAFVSSFSGALQQYRLSDDGQGKLAGALVRTVTLGTGPIEGLAADDRSRQLYLALGGRGLYRLNADADAGDTAFEVDTVDSGRLEGLKGIALYPTGNSGGYLIASASLTSRFPVYSLGAGTPFVTSFNVVADGGLSGVTNSRALEVVALPLGAPFDRGLLVAHDELNPTGPNYKLVRWDAIAGATTPPLAVDLRYDPRQGPSSAGDAGPDASAPDASTRCPVPSGDGGADGGVDGGDAGATDGGRDAGCSSSGGGGGGFRPPIGGSTDPIPTSCGCGQTIMLFPLAALIWLQRLYRRRRFPIE